MLRPWLVSGHRLVEADRLRIGHLDALRLRRRLGDLRLALRLVGPDELGHPVTTDPELAGEGGQADAGLTVTQEKLDPAGTEKILGRDAVHEHLDVAGLTGEQGRTATGKAAEGELEVLADGGRGDLELAGEGLDAGLVLREVATEKGLDAGEIESGLATGGSELGHDLFPLVSL